MSLLLENISVSLGGGKSKRPILQHANLHCAPGELVALCGANGAGKSTLLKTITGDIAYSAGSVSFSGIAANRLDNESLARHRAVMEQQVSMVFPFSVREIIALGLTFCRCEVRKREITQEVVELFDLHSLLDNDYTQLSGGQQQRVQLARVVAQILQSDLAHKYLLLDECTSAMDIAMMHTTFANLKTLCQQGIGMVAVVHDINLASLYADRIVFVAEGTTLMDGKPEAVINVDSIKRVFNADVLLSEHPQTQKPMIMQAMAL